MTKNTLSSKRIISCCATPSYTQNKYVSGFIVKLSNYKRLSQFARIFDSLKIQQKCLNLQYCKRTFLRVSNTVMLNESILAKIMHCLSWYLKWVGGRVLSTKDKTFLLLMSIVLCFEKRALQSALVCLWGCWKLLLFSNGVSVPTIIPIVVAKKMSI